MTHATLAVQMQWVVRIPMRDGIHLNALLYLPPQHITPTLSIFTLTPYVAQTWHDYAVYFAENGYPFLAVDTRGRGNSEGEFDPFVNDGQDGYDVVEWIAQQSFCNGQVGMWGGSYAGFDQWATAKELPPHLATLVPVSAAYIGVDMPIQNNVCQPYVMQWLTLVSGRTLQDRLFFHQETFWGRQFQRWFESGTPFGALDSFLGHPSPTFQKWISHPCQDSYWDQCNPTSAQYGKLTFPILTITGHFDSDQPGALMHYREHLKNSTAAGRANHFLVIGPWDHAGTRAPKRHFCGITVGSASLIDLPKLHLEWYAWAVQNGPRPPFLQKSVAYYVMGAEEWRYADTLEAVTSHVVPFYLHSNGNPTDVFDSGSLTSAPSTSTEPDKYRYDPRDVSLAGLEATVDPESRADQRMVFASVGKHLVYHSAPFEKDVEVSGFFKLSAWIAIDTPDTDFRAAVYEVGIDGDAILLSADWIRARHRECLRAERLIRTAEPLRYDFERFTFVSRLIKQGNRLRLVVGPLHSIYFQKNYNSGGVVSGETMDDARPVTAALYHDTRHPSALYVPIGHAQTSTASASDS